MSTRADVRGLTKSYGAFTALQCLDLTVRAGEVHGFLGPNGAGKPTTIRALLGLLRIDGGQARVFGLAPSRDAMEIHARRAYVPGDVNCGPTLTGGEVIDVVSDLRGDVGVLGPVVLTVSAVAPAAAGVVGFGRRDVG